MTKSQHIFNFVTVDECIVNMQERQLESLGERKIMNQFT